jgi:hypothetical protein|tara:strand:- start:166 stop:420 length:255 start_codon:yes stop_codon:yes gene_type:complete
MASIIGVFILSPILACGFLSKWSRAVLPQYTAHLLDALIASSLKQKAANQIDGIVALAMACLQTVQEQSQSLEVLSAFCCLLNG